MIMVSIISISLSKVEASNVVPIPGGYIIKDITIEEKGSVLLDRVPGGIRTQVKNKIIARYGKIENSRLYRVIYDNRVQQVGIYSYKGVIENVRVRRL